MEIEHDNIPPGTKAALLARNGLFRFLISGVMALICLKVFRFGYVRAVSRQAFLKSGSLDRICDLSRR